MDALEHQINFHKQQFEEVKEYSITIPEYRERSKNPNNECFIPLVPKDISSKKLDYQIASEFTQFLSKNNIKTIKDITMTTKTDNAATSKEQKLAQMGDLMTYLTSCTRAFLDELILTFNDEDAVTKYQYAHSIKSKQDAMYQIITKDPDKGLNQFHAIRDFNNYVQGSAQDVKEAQTTLKSYRDDLRSSFLTVGI